MAGLVIRLIVSLAIVVGLLLLLSRVVNGRFKGRSGAAIQVLHRQSLARNSSVAVIAVGGRVLLVGATEHEITLLSELDPDELDLDVVMRQSMSPPAASSSQDEPGADAPYGGFPAGGRLDGSILSTNTWRQAWAAVNKKKAS